MPRRSQCRRGVFFRRQSIVPRHRECSPDFTHFRGALALEPLVVAAAAGTLRFQVRIADRLLDYIEPIGHLAVAELDLARCFPDLFGKLAEPLRNRS